ncbi:MAG: DNA primase [Aquificota bacterium]|nr:DNA primase [Aquificota bacterium]
MSSDIEDLRRELDIVDVISEYLNLERVGSNYRTNCPFHPDRTPSFYVSPSRQIFKCFGCGVGGDAIKFVSLYENVSYMQAALQLARKYRIRVRIKEGSPEDTETFRVLEEVADFYHSQIRKSDEALAYLRNRGIDISTIRRFKIGFSLSSEDLVSFLKEIGGLEVYERTGNISKVGEDRYRDLFFGRIVIPIRDHKGRVVGFGGRAVRDSGPKYVNSPESEVFRKREVLFGLHESVNYIKDLGYCIVVEGYFDVIRMHQEGFRNTVAPLGTSFGEAHARILSRFTRKVYLLFDGDEAGRRAVRIAAPHLLREGIDVYPVFLPEGVDPEDFLKGEGKIALRKLIESGSDLFGGLMRDIEEGTDREAKIKDFMYFVSFMKDEIKAYTMVSELSKKTKIPQEVLLSHMYPKERIERPREEGPKLSWTERIFLKGLMDLKPDISLDELNLTPRVREIAESIMREEYYEVPEEVINLKVENLEEGFREAIQRIKIDIPEEEIRENRTVREVIREWVRTHRGGFRPLRRRRA